MIVVRVELHSAKTGKVTELARMHITNDGSGSERWGNYLVKTLRGRSKSDLDKGRLQRVGRVEHHGRRLQHVWMLVQKALNNLGYFE